MNHKKYYINYSNKNFKGGDVNNKKKIERNNESYTIGKDQYP